MPRVVDGSKFNTVGVTPGTAGTTVYTVPANHAAIVRHFSLSNNNSGAKKVTVQYYDSKSTTYYFIAQDLSLAANSYINILNSNVLTLNALDKIIITAETAGTISALVSVEEYYEPNR